MTTAYSRFDDQRDNDLLLGVTRLGRKVLNYAIEFKRTRRRLPRNAEIRDRFRFGEHTLCLLLEQLESAGLVHLESEQQIAAAIDTARLQ